MRIQDLAIGDWVTFSDSAKEGEIVPVLVAGVTAPDICLGIINPESNDITQHCDELDVDITQPCDELSVEELAGIPLTPEILEKNGFRFDGSGRRSMMFISEPHFADGIRFNIYVGLKHKTIEAFAAHPVEKSPNWRKSNKVYLEVCGCYVHELQHALRLCGIEKEIEL